MDRFGTLTQLFTAVALLGGVCHCWEAYVQGPVNAVRGSCVLVPCNTVTYRNVKWYAYRRMSYPVVYSNDRSEIMDEFKGRTSVPNAQNGNCTLKIDNVRQQDSEVDLYVWIWTYGEDKGFYDRTIKINILDPVRPHMSVANTQVEGKPFTATCRFRHSCPSAPPQMSWQGLSSTSNVLTHRKDAEGLWETEATATFRVTRQNQGARLSCRTVLSGQTLESGSVSLDISYAPTDVKIDYIGRTSVVEGEKISLQCTSKGKPQPTAYEWLVTQNNNTIRLKGSTVLLQDVRRRTSVSCIATNSVGHGESKQLSLDVHYAPMDVKVDYTGNTTVVEGNEISLRCVSDSRPTPTHYEWLVTQNNTTRHYKVRTLVLRDVRRDTSVSCIATNTIGRGESKQLSLNVHYSPSIVQGLFCSMQNRKLQCVCQAEAKPSVVISWTVDGSSEVFPPFNTTTQHNGSMTVSELTGPQGHNVTCTATNSVGSEFTQILVQSEGDTSAVFAVVGASAGVCVILGLAVTVLMIWKKRRHAVPRGGLSTAQHVTANKTCHDYSLESDEDLYVNAVRGQQVYEDQDAESCIYQNYDKSS
ncbi:B-cell receptor CD22 isoform X1 [Ictalurus furcatus]|uniref:B-cell receptor CD22 isoform X1 n=1 Tax=Ictalurus furcatus TaxID=66913 RepID=UPI002350B3A2|nr:B-cell receptor CD22 isoform X1 [Ictalurus furcatus]XP_053467655.1 B-cell receptor CD22 isoform X1 [Ictalurus furcatus]XP_053467656.1 B-cell receptor CD22 isoform X1 [Ictalurus furcatus]